MAQFQVIPRNSPREKQKNNTNLRDAGLLAEVRNPDLQAISPPPTRLRVSVHSVSFGYIATEVVTGYRSVNREQCC